MVKRSSKVVEVIKDQEGGLKKRGDPLSDSEK
jgi:hypothetical protein